ncbi:MAG: SIR2 family protein [Candidatus Acidiferrales bacterium]
MPHVIINGKLLRPPLNRDFFHVADRFAESQENDAIAGRLKRVRKVFHDEFPTRGLWPLPMETAFSLLYVSKDFPEIYAPQTGRRRTAGTRQEIQDFLRLTFGILTAVEAHAPAENPYSRLVSALGPRDTIVTLNYDTILDKALVKAGWSDPHFGYDLLGSANKVRWHMKRPACTSRLDKVRLLKLHGSLNWYIGGSFNRIGKVFDAKPTKVMMSEQPRTNELSGHIRQIVPPIYGKFFNNPHWRRLWKRAYEALVRADCIVVVGCSLSSTDFHLSGMLSHAVIKRKSVGRKFRRAILVDRVSTRRRWEDVLKGCVSEKVVFATFEQFASHL